MPTNKSEAMKRRTVFSERGIRNCGCLLLLIAGVLALFIAWPVITEVRKRPFSNNGAFNIGGINSSGQIPAIPGNWGLIDLDTPKEAYTIPSWNDPSKPMQLIFSDEFNVDGRTFYPGDDPYWEAVDLHYWATNNLEWYDPEAITTENGSLVITLSQKETHDLHYEGGENKFCFTGGYIEASVQLPGFNNILGFWPAIWTMGNLGRAGYGASLEGTWPYTYDTCDVGTVANQTVGGLPVAATIDGDHKRGGVLSYLPGQKLSRCTCAGESHPGPKHPDGTFVGRAAPEIDVFEAQINQNTLIADVSQSAQWAPFNRAYIWDNSSDNLIIADPTITAQNPFVGSATQQATSVTTNTDLSCYELDGGCYSIYGFEYKPGFDSGYITWISSGKVSWTLRSPGLGPDPSVQIGARPVPEEPMYLIMNLGMSTNFGPVDLDHLPFPAHMRVDYIRVYQPEGEINIGCNPKDFPTEDYINQYIEAYTNPNLTTWVNDFQQPWPKNSFLGQC
ncbi:glycoside hydrolase family 16 protein [Macrolepiota fuliginosa MF-IS2]|uniref:Glycoside hydrolase family 16 protein n=1 Tax=Macrolepiota fuliginosa MF-IS2 TaxID=1400762 RepID=A0A9P5XK83_9AGAR|nr:glycoside hydrolase family 16 protein [Macrolepiota fuliginosa MF-IS2]